MASVCTATGATMARCYAGAGAGMVCRGRGSCGIMLPAVLEAGRSDYMGISFLDAQQQLASCSKLDMRKGRGVLVVARSTNGGAAPYRPPYIGTGTRRSQSKNQDTRSNDSPLMNTDIRVPLVRLLDVEQNMLGVMSSAEALERAKNAEVDLVMISADADPPVVRMMNYSKYRYEMQKKKREAQKKAAAGRQVMKELKMRYNIDTHDYAVRQRAAQKFLAAGDKVKVVCQFKGRELDFKDLAVKLFQRFQEEIGPLAVLETKIALEGKTMFMVLAPNKVAIQRAQAAAQSQSAKLKSQGEEKKRIVDGDFEADEDVGEDVDEDEDVNEDVNEDEDTSSQPLQESPASV